MPSTDLIARSLVSGYRGKGVTPVVELCLAQGSVVALVGTNGCGKSTTLKTVLGLLPPVSGSVHIQGVGIENLSLRERSRRVAYVAQRESDAIDMTAYEYVSTARYACSGGLWESEEDRRAVESALEWASVGDPKKRLSGFSGGERQRLSLARALAQETPFILLDEPANHLDPGQARRLGATVRNLAAQGKGILLVSHDVRWVESYADEAVLFMPEGAISGLARDVLSEANLAAAFD